jgi:hypothetical protein
MIAGQISSFCKCYAVGLTVLTDLETRDQATISNNSLKKNIQLLTANSRPHIKAFCGQLMIHTIPER